MGKRDLALKSYLSDPVRYADVYNGSVFGGVQVLDASQLEEAGTVVTKADDGVLLERTCDIAMRQKTDGGLFTLWILENQEEVDYGMSVRIMLRETLEYDRQVRALKRRNEAEYRESHGEIPAGEYLYKIRKSDRIRPVCTLIIYWGSKPWDGPKSLHEFLDFSGYDESATEELKKLIPEYPLHILDLNEENDYSRFHTSLRTVLELYARQVDKGQFMNYVKTHKECRHLDVETYEIIGKLLNSEKLWETQEMIGEGEEERDMYDVIGELIEDGRAEGRIQGKAEGSAHQMIAIINSLMEKLHCTLEEACEFAGKSVEEYRRAEELL
ncbi:MAG: Rpn family recombination-promoting nuclease/putative transposase [Acetatifactor sp.]|nr:Rpn family recombination-promoting nuclease/putative transposase [Acetatifactor sp.]